ncbi:MAG: lytic transglycosylase domain-containing protein [Sideroxydans sp.]|nr:lytic transglycosylase domain-containing protein [Sideroxydans sp.]
MKFSLLFLLLWPAVSWADTEADFMSAREAFRVGDSVRLANLSAKLKQTPLEPYVTYYQLRMRWDEADIAPIQKYFAREATSPVIDQFRAEWLKHMGKQQRWDAFASEYANLINGDAELTCYALQLQRKTNEAAVLRAAREVWLASAAAPVESCSSVFDAALNAQVITPQDLMQRIRTLLEAGNVTQAKKLIPKLPDEQRLPLADLDAAVKNPQRYLSQTLFKANDSGQRSVAMFALQRLARQSVEIAQAQYGGVASLFPENEQRYFYAWLAHAAAREQDARALKWYWAAGDTALTDAQIAWRARAALRAYNWHEVWESISTMTPQQQSEGTWRYWKARALKELGRKEEATALFVPLAREYNYYGQLAAEELGAKPGASIVTTRFQADEKEVAAMQARPAIQRTVLLYRMGLRTEAAKEWDWALRGLSDRELLVASIVAQRNEMHDRSINAANRTVELHDFNLRYPAPYREAMQAPLKEHALEEAWVYGLMRQESRFTQNAKSTVGAAGLMQIMPETAQWAARRIGMKSYRKALIHDTDVNLRLGTYYMKNVYSQFGDNPVMASAAYNAGPSRARKWRGNIALEGAIYAETIPFDETRDYVKKVMSNTLIYAKLFGQTTASLKQRMGMISPKSSNNQQVVNDEI